MGIQTSRISLYDSQARKNQAVTSREVQVIAGAFPATLNDDETRSILATLLSLGTASFVCLQAEFSLEETEENWRSGVGLRPYIKDAVDVLRYLPKSDRLYVHISACLIIFLAMTLIRYAMVHTMQVEIYERTGSGCL